MSVGHTLTQEMAGADTSYYLWRKFGCSGDDIQTFVSSVRPGRGFCISGKCVSAACRESGRASL